MGFYEALLEPEDWDGAESQPEFFPATCGLETERPNVRALWSPSNASRPAAKRRVNETAPVVRRHAPLR